MCGQPIHMQHIDSFVSTLEFLSEVRESFASVSQNSRAVCTVLQVKGLAKSKCQIILAECKPSESTYPWHSNHPKLSGTCHGMAILGFLLDVCLVPGPCC